MPDNPYQLAQKFRAGLVRRDAVRLKEISDAYEKVIKAIEPQIVALMKKREAAIAAGQFVSPSWLYREQRLQSLLKQSEAELSRFFFGLNRSVTNAQAIEADYGSRQVESILTAANSSLSFSRLPTSAIENIVGFSGDGSPLHKLLSKIPGDGVNLIKDTLIAAVATGQGAARTASQVREALGGNRARALTITRTETLRAYREATRQTAAAVGVESWQWLASKSERTCLACLALDGQIFKISKPFPHHPNCRCTMLLLPPGYTLASYQTGAEWFDLQTDEVKAKMMSKDAFAAYQRGDVTLQDFIGVHKSKSWGEMRYQKSWKNVQASKGKTNNTIDPVKPARDLPIIIPKNTQVKRGDGSDQVLRNIFGRNLSDIEISRISGAIDDAKIEVNPVGNEIRLIIKHPLIASQQRTVSKTEKGEIFIHNDIFRLQKTAPKGTGKKAFLTQVTAAQELKISFLETLAAGSYEERHVWNGYYTWPRFGYNGEFEEPERVKLQQTEFSKAKDIADLFRLGGKDWWKFHGSWREVRFDLNSNSKSVENLLNYLLEKEQEKLK